MPELSQLLQSIDAERLMEHVVRIACFERSPASEEEDAAFAYIQAVLSAYGLSVRMDRLPAYVSMPRAASLVINGASIPCTTHAMLPSASVCGELVSFSDASKLHEQELAGKIVVVEGLAMAPVVAAAQKAHAQAVLFIAGEKEWHEMIVSPVWGSPEPEHFSAYCAIPAVTVNYTQGEKIKLCARSGMTAAIDTTVTTQWQDLPVLSVDIGPVENGYLLLSGHVDSWHKGAMDNASGNAVALELAALFSRIDHKLQRGIRVVFWSGHSHGRYAGSAAYCDAFFQDLYDNAFLHVNIDCLGAQGATLLTQAACMPETWNIGNFALNRVTGQSLEGTHFSRSCDQSFWGTGTPSLFSSVSEQPKPRQADAAAKAFALMFGGSKSGGYGWWWHTSADTVDKIDRAFLLRDCQIFLAAVYMACTEERIPFDVQAGFAEFATTVRDYAREARYELDFSLLLEELAKAERRFALLDLKSLTPACANRLVMQIEKKLVPLMYVKGSRFTHDPALRQPLLPLLEDVHLLRTAMAESMKKALRVKLRRRLNKVVCITKELSSLVAFTQQEALS